MEWGGGKPTWKNNRATGMPSSGSQTTVTADKKQTNYQKK